MKLPIKGLCLQTIESHTWDSMLALSLDTDEGDSIRDQLTFAAKIRC